jgi:hypothetical protein
MRLHVGSVSAAMAAVVLTMGTASAATGLTCKTAAMSGNGSTQQQANKQWETKVKAQLGAPWAILSNASSYKVRRVSVRSW